MVKTYKGNTLLPGTIHIYVSNHVWLHDLKVTPTVTIYHHIQGWPWPIVILLSCQLLHLCIPFMQADMHLYNIDKLQNLVFFNHICRAMIFLYGQSSENSSSGWRWRVKRTWVQVSYPLITGMVPRFFSGWYFALICECYWVIGAHQTTFVRIKF